MAYVVVTEIALPVVADNFIIEWFKVLPRFTYHILEFLDRIFYICFIVFTIDNEPDYYNDRGSQYAQAKETIVVVRFFVLVTHTSSTPVRV